MENCETSALGRALANLGIGIDTSIASSNEVAIAIAKQNSTPKAPAPAKPTLKTLTDEIKANMIKAVADGKSDAVEKALVGYKVTAKLKKEILSA